jgi:hypothetical protein
LVTTFSLVRKDYLCFSLTLRVVRQSTRWPRVLEQLAYFLEQQHLYAGRQLVSVRNQPILALSSLHPFTHFFNTTSFIGSDQFCFKACDNSIKEPDYCNNIYDQVGCSANMPAAYAPNVFLSCVGDNQVPPNGGDIPIPATSSCTTYTSSLLYPNVRILSLFFASFGPS